MDTKTLIVGALMCLSGIFPAYGQDRAFELPRSRIISIQDTATERTYEIHIQLPRRYSEDETYPVVYMTDSPYTFPIVTGSARYPVNFSYMENLMFVGISWQSDHSAALSRQRDYTPTVDSKSFKDPTGEADTHLKFIQAELIPYIESNFSVDPSRRTYIGNSFGGLFGAHILLTSPETFQNYVLGSPSLWWDNKYMLGLVSQENVLSLDLQARVFIAVGENENPEYTGGRHNLVADAIKFHSLLEEKEILGLSLKLHIVDSANHETAFPTTAIQGLWWLFEK